MRRPVDNHRFVTVSRSLTDPPSRRDVLRGLVAAGLGLDVLRRPKRVVGKNGRRKKPLRRNTFGCVDIGGPCRGKDKVCCSGRCHGRKPKQGNKDTSRCVAHDASTCQPGQRITEVCGGAVDVPCTASTGAGGACNTTTGNAPYCADELFCRACTKDADCRDFCGKAAACVICAGCAEGGTACASPAVGVCDFPP